MTDDQFPSDLSSIQRYLDQWIRLHGRYWSPLSQFARLAEEVGELGRELNFRYGDKPRTPKDEPASVTDELGDVFFIVVSLANQLDIDLGQALHMALQKYELRRST